MEKFCLVFNQISLSEPNDLPDDVLTKVTLFYYSDPRDALIKGLAE